MNTFVVLVNLILLLNTDPGLKITEEKVSLVIDKKMSREQLMEYKSELWKKKKISLNFEKLHYNLSNEIENINISVDCHDGFKGTASANLQTDSRRIGFQRIYDDKAPSPFEIGSVD